MMERRQDPNAKFRILEGTSLTGAGRAYAILSCGTLFREGDDEGEILFGEAFAAVPTSSRSWKVKSVRLTFRRGQLNIEVALKMVDDYLWRIVRADLEEYLIGWRNDQGPGMPFPPPYAFNELDPEVVAPWLREIFGSNGLEDLRRSTLSAPVANYVSWTRGLGEVRRE